MTGKFPSLIASLRSLYAGQGLLPLIEREMIKIPGTSNGLTVRVLQWNVLAQALTQGDSRYTGLPDSVLRYDVRKLRIAEEILLREPDIVCLQEVDMFTYLQSVLTAAGYDGMFMPKLRSPTLKYPNNIGPDGCALFYRRDVLLLENRVDIGIPVDGELSNQVAIFCTFVPQCRRGLREATPFGVVVTHLKAKVELPDIRLKQATYLLDEITNNPCRSVIICGDLNGSPREPMYRCFEDNNLGLTSAYTKLRDDRKEPQFTSLRQPSHYSNDDFSSEALDYIWYTAHSLSLVSVLQLPPRSPITTIPNLHFPSDHFDLVCDFVV